jgi:UDP-N-acetylmuramoyl-tripeptide--D-alanyl-D-alanine ligase
VNNAEPKKIKITKSILRTLAFLILKKYNPKIVSITGSVGKTSTKEAVFSVLASRFRVRRSEKNYNNEIGLPLTIIGAESGGNSIMGWLKVFLKWLVAIIFPVEYPEILILEMGADRPGDIEYLTSFVKSNVGIVTDVSFSHIEFFENLERVAKEKMSLFQSLDDKSLAIINTDNPYIEKLKGQVKCRLVTFGFSDSAEMRATDVFFNYSEGREIKGLSFKLNYRGTTLPVRLNNVLAKHQIYPALVAVAVGFEFGINLVESTALLVNFSAPRSRLNIVQGIKNTVIIDDTYNASPASVGAALEVLGEIKSSRKIAVLGDMLELGGETEKSHKGIGRKFLEIKGDVFFAIGSRMKFAVAELEQHGFKKENIFSFDNPMDTGKKIQEVMKEGDLVLVKGSQGMRMEKVIEEIMAEPQKAGELLCRQSQEWKVKPFKSV